MPAPPQNLDPASIPLSGRHLIEASAGTGKTYNITRIYLRLLLEKALSVQQILVMTFTKAATEELRARIDQTLRDALLNWDTLVTTDPFFIAMHTQYSKESAAQKLRPALLELDEAAIFTIHGFCSRALSRQAFASGLAMDLSMAADSQAILLEAVRDWLRTVALDETQFALLSAKGWHIPEHFLQVFLRALNTSGPLEAIEDKAVDHAFLSDHHQQKTTILALLKTHEAEIRADFITPHDATNTLTTGWQALCAWLADERLSACSQKQGDFLQQKRLAKKAYASIKTLLRPVYEFKKNYNKALKPYQNALAAHQAALSAQVVVEGISTIRNSFAEAKSQRALMDFDDLITYLSQRLQADTGQPLIDALRSQYPVALVDEFQDTDPHQYAILETLYPNHAPEHALFMIGDPKQAIYAFRGGDIFTYLQAREQADYHWHMDTNWRSVEGVVTAYNRLFWGGPLTEPSQHDVFGYNIGYQPIQATENAPAAKLPLQDPQTQFAAINYAWLAEVANPSGKKGLPTSADWHAGLAHWCVAEISRLLAEVQLDGAALQEQHIAILVRTGSEARTLQNTLSTFGFPSVYLSAKDNIFHSEQAQELRLVLRGILELENETLLISALSTALMGGDTQQLAAYHAQHSEHTWEKQRDKALMLRTLWLKKGCMSMIMQLIGQTYQPHPAQHERALTNMIHLAELLQQAARQHQHPQQLLKWFDYQCQADNPQNDAQLRLESDANLIRIVTQHGAKGLEYPIVFIPFASHYKAPLGQGQSTAEYFEYHVPETHQLKRLVGKDQTATDAVTAETHAESIRLLYVAITRATHRCYVGVAPLPNSHRSPLGLTLKLAAVDDWATSLHTFMQTTEGSSALIPIAVEPQPIFERQTNAADPAPWVVAKRQHQTQDHWSLSSFSALVRGTHPGRQEQKDRADESTPLNHSAPPSSALRFTLRKGADAGNLLHDILEQTNFEAPNDWPLAVPLRRFGGLESTQQVALTQWLQSCLDAPLPNIGTADDTPFSLSCLSWSHTLRETEFYFPMQQVSLSDLSACLQTHRGCEQPVYLPGSTHLHGMMHGFIDLIFEHDGRFYVADYKSTHLGDQVEDYHWQALKHNNQDHYYDLQYLIYSLALHRYLAVRLPDYDPAQHFGGVYYLYLRGMHALSADYSGIFHTAIPASLLAQLDHLFQAEQPQEQRA